MCVSVCVYVAVYFNSLVVSVKRSEFGYAKWLYILREVFCDEDKSSK